MEKKRRETLNGNQAAYRRAAVYKEASFHFSFFPLCPLSLLSFSPSLFFSHPKSDREKTGSLTRNECDISRAEIHCVEKMRKKRRKGIFPRIASVKLPAMFDAP